MVLYGRHRVGKSFLIAAFREGKNGIYFEAMEDGTERTQLKLMFKAAFISIFDDIATKAEKEKFYFAIDEFFYLCEVCPEMIGLLLHYTDAVLRKTKLVLILSDHSEDSLRKIS